MWANTTLGLLCFGGTHESAKFQAELDKYQIGTYIKRYELFMLDENPSPSGLRKGFVASPHEQP